MPDARGGHHSCRALLRCHPPPNMHKMTELSRTAAELGFELDTSGAGGREGCIQGCACRPSGLAGRLPAPACRVLYASAALPAELCVPSLLAPPQRAGPLQRSLCALREAASTDPAALEVITLLATKPMQARRGVLGPCAGAARRPAPEGRPAPRSSAATPEPCPPCGCRFCSRPEHALLDLRFPATPSPPRPSAERALLLHRRDPRRVLLAPLCAGGVTLHTLHLTHPVRQAVEPAPAPAALGCPGLR